MSTNPITQEHLSEEYTTRQRKHYSGSRGSLGVGLVPDVEEKPVPHSLTRQRIVHDTAEQYDTTNLNGSGQKPQGNSPWLSSYQAQCQGADANVAKRPGRKIVAPPVSQYAPDRMGAARFTADAPEDPVALQLGTTKVTGHVPGYTGFIPRTNVEDNAGTQTRGISKDLLVENYRQNLPGYTGSRR